jgi:hypothetical protein
MANPVDWAALVQGAQPKPNYVAAAPAPIAAPAAPQGMAAAPGFAELRRELEALRMSTSKEAQAAAAKARREADPEQARYPVVETPEQEAKARADLTAKGLSSDMIDKRIAKFRKKGGKIKTSATLMKVGRILGDTLAGYNPRGYQPGQPIAPFTQQHQARIESAGEIARTQAEAAGDQQAKLLLTEAQYGLEKTAKLAEEERATIRKREDEEYALVLRDRAVARDLGIPDYMGPIEIIRQQIAAARAADAQAENKVKRLEEQYGILRNEKAGVDVQKARVDTATAKVKLRELPGKQAKEEEYRAAKKESLNLTVEEQIAKKEERLAAENAKIKGESTDPVEVRAIRAEKRKADAAGVVDAQKLVAFIRNQTPASLMEMNRNRIEKGDKPYDAETLTRMLIVKLDAAGLVEFDELGNPTGTTPAAQKVLQGMAQAVTRLWPTE